MVLNYLYVWLWFPDFASCVQEVHRLLCTLYLGLRARSEIYEKRALIWFESFMF
jgi:hypothetical protein